MSDRPKVQSELRGERAYLQHASWRKQYFHFQVVLEGTDNVMEQ